MSLKQLMDLTGKVAVITGGSRGLGLQMAEALGELGAKLVITARKEHELEDAAELLKAQGAEVLTIATDLSRHETIPELVDQIISHYGNIDILVNNAGTSWGAPAEDHPLEAWRKVMSLNVDAVFLLTQEIGKRCMIPNQSGKIINIASVAGLLGNPPHMQTIAYNTSKGAVVNFTRTLAAEWGKYNINVNAICPGPFPSKLAKYLVEDMREEVLAMTPLGRIGGPEDLKGIAALFATEASRHITGQAVAVDGGSVIY